MAAARSFVQQVAKKAGLERVVEFTLGTTDGEVDEEGEPVYTESVDFHAAMPSEESLFLIAALAGSDDASAAQEAAAIMDIFREALPEEEFTTLKKRLRTGLTSLSTLQEVMAFLMEEWSGFPTEPQSASVSSPGRTGTKSSGRVRGPGSTR